MTEALLTIAIAMFGITSLTQKRWLLYFAGTVALIGIVLGLTAFYEDQSAFRISSPRSWGKRRDAHFKVIFLFQEEDQSFGLGKHSL